MEASILRERIQARLAATGKKAVPVSKAIGKGRDYLPDFLTRKKESIGIEVLQPLAEQLECPIDYLIAVNADDAMAPREEQEVLVRVRGYVGASPDGRVQFATGDATSDFALMPPGATPGAVALYVNGHSMPGVADEGSLIFYEETRSPPTPDMLGHVVVVETELGDVLVKRLLRGERKGVYDLESIGAPPLQNQRLHWAAHILAVVPPYRARQIIRTLVA